MQSSALSSSTNLYDLSRQEMSELFSTWGLTDFYANRLWHALYRQQATNMDEFIGIRPDILAQIRAETHIGILPVQAATDSNDGFTRKFLLTLQDNQTIETVLMIFKGRTTACVSTQAGCAMGCVFCATGQMGFFRHLTAGEIVAQVLHISRILQRRDQELRNIVLMGMGEPLHNYDATMKALDIIMDHNGLSIAAKHITLSTVGLVPAIKRLADEERPVRLAVSLHGATDAERQALVPIANRWPLQKLIDACRYYSQKRRRRIFFEWTLIAGENDTPKQAHALGQLLQGLDAHVNLIPLNPTIGYDGRPAHEEGAKEFQAILSHYDLPSTVRQRRGIDIAAGCGQLRARETDVLSIKADDNSETKE